MGMDGGKSKLSTLLLLLLVGFAALAAFQFLKTGFTKKEIKQEVYDAVGNMRTSGDFEAMQEEVRALLERKGVTPIKVSVKPSGANISLQYTYEIETNYFITKNKEQVTVVDQVAAF